MNHSYHEMIIGHGGCFSTIVSTENTGEADYHQAQYLATQMESYSNAGKERIASITLKRFGGRIASAPWTSFRQAATARPAGKLTMARFRPPGSRTRKNPTPLAKPRAGWTSLVAAWFLGMHPRYFFCFTNF